MEINIALDESGNFGDDGGFVIVGGVQVSNKKSVSNFMKNQELRFRKKYPQKFSNVEIKHKNSFPAMRYYYIEKIAQKVDCFHYCATNKNNIDKSMLEDENILYNYMVYRIVLRVIRQNPKIKKLNIILDQRTTKITRRDGLTDYIKGKVFFDLKRPDINLTITMFDSEHNRLIQAADFIAGCAYHYYTHENDLCYNLIKEKLDCCYHYPYNNF
ncbi:DUF3800 domain-containing protein [Macrococcoides canis]|uniref:DUF3800 domain-containing protein n=1 Tax=Macrococcoides canis TaxID=1855823 RepID=UPI001F39618B|nr:DUF3800 domain-containing protein [Macrococcus canis]UJS27758.1 DUF3800 domain-containing protein [Macrococcus canis]